MYFMIRGKRTGATDRRGTDQLVQGGLAEAYRLASDARTVLASKYEDAMALLAIGGMALWTFLLFACFSTLWPIFHSYLENLLLATVLTMVVLVPLIVVVRGKYREKIEAQRRWIERLQRAMSPYAAREGISSFDLLMEASHQVLYWSSIRRRDRFNRHPFLITTVFIAGASVAYLIVQIFSTPSVPGLGYLFLLLGTVIAVLLISLAIIISADRRERDALLERWGRRMEESRKAMEEYLGGL